MYIVRGVRETIHAPVSFVVVGGGLNERLAVRKRALSCLDSLTVLELYFKFCTEFSIEKSYRVLKGLSEAYKLSLIHI